MEERFCIHGVSKYERCAECEASECESAIALLRAENERLRRERDERWSDADIRRAFVAGVCPTDWPGGAAEYLDFAKSERSSDATHE